METRKLRSTKIHPVHSVRVITDPVTKIPRGYGYVNFAYDLGYFPVDEAVRRLNCTVVRGKQICVVAAERFPDRRRRSDGNIFVKGLDPEIDSQTLHDTFDIFGPVLSAKVATSSEGESLGYGYVQYLQTSSAEEAIRKANKMMLKQKTIAVERFRPRSERGKEPFTNVFIKNLPVSVETENQLMLLFKEFGAITSVCLPRNDEGCPRGFGFVNFANPANAKTATMNMHGMEVEGRELYVQRAQTRTERRKFLEQRYRETKKLRERETKGRNLYIKNFPSDTTDEDLITLFSRFGSIDSVKVMRAKERSRGFGFVCFSTVKEATLALTTMNGYVIGGKRLYVNIAQSAEERRQLLSRMKSMEPYHYFPQGPCYYPPLVPFPPMVPLGSCFEYTQMMSTYSSTTFSVQPVDQVTWRILKRRDKMIFKQTEGDYNDEKGKEEIDQTDPEIVELGFKLYEIIIGQNSNQSLAQKITGMLLDLGKEEAKRLLEDRDCLQDRINESLTVLANAGYFGGTKSKTDHTS